MAYTPFTWVEKVSKVGPTNMNHLELGVQAAAAVADSATTAAAAAQTTANAALPTPAGSNGQFLKKVGGVWVPTSFALSDIPDPTTGKVVGSSGGVATAVFPPGYEFAQVSTTTTVPVLVSTEAAPTDVVTLPAATFDGATAVWIEFSCLLLVSGAVGETLGVSVWEGATDLGRLFVAENVAAQTMIVPAWGRIRVTPTAAAHTYKIRGWQSGGTTGSSVVAGAGGVGSNPPAFATITKV